MGCEEDKVFIAHFQMGDLVGKLGRVTGAQHKYNKLVTVASWNKDMICKVVKTTCSWNKGRVAGWLLTFLNKDMIVIPG